MKMIILATLVALAVGPTASAQTQKPRSENTQAAELRRAMQDPDYVFARMDTNRDGVISRAEFRAAHSKVRQRMSDRREARMERRQERQR